MITSRHTLGQAGAPPLPPTGRLTLRRPDFIGLVGLAMLLVGAWFIFTRHYPPPLWVTWIIGPTLWYLGVATTIVWLSWRLFQLKSSVNRKRSASSR